MCRNIPSFAAFTFVAVLASCSASAQALLEQNFNNSSNLQDYISPAAPTSAQFNAISSGSQNTASIGAGSLVFTKTGNSFAGFSRTTDFSPVPSALLFQFDLTISGNSVAQSSSTEVIIQIGSGFDTNAAAAPNNSVHSRIALNWTATAGEWSIRQGGGAAADRVSSNRNGTQTVRFYVNNSGLTLNYPGIDNNSYSLANDTYDVWIGSSRDPNLAGVVATSGEVALTDLKFAYVSGAANATIAFDNLSVTAIPEPASFAFIAALASAASLAFRRRKPACLRGT